MLPTLVRLQHIPPDKRQEMEEIIAWRLMGSDASADDRRWRDGVIRRSHNAALLERRLRMALGRAIRYRCANGWGVYRSQCMIRMSGAIGMQWH